MTIVAEKADGLCTSIDDKPPIYIFQAVVGALSSGRSGLKGLLPRTGGSRTIKMKFKELQHAGRQ